MYTLGMTNLADAPYMCDLCYQPLAEADDRCNSGLHVGPGDGNAYNGHAIPADERLWMPWEMRRHAS